ncbi:MAG TPA: hypothetical protein VGR27_09735 [Longimicrobiaceae bacterium]|nr:hypothetical protein [Longimicrobiaceae bacterium]
MLGLIALTMTVAATVVGYLQTRSFVVRRLAYVDAVHRPGAGLLAGFGAAAMATPIAWIVPLIGTGTAILFGAGVGMGVRHGARMLRRRLRAA